MSHEPLFPPTEQLLLTRDTPGIGGQAKSQPEDFVVEEIPLYEPCDEGEHTFVFLEKRGITTFEAIRRLTRALGAEERFAGHAGLKDAQALTRQWISVAGVEPAQAEALELTLERDKLRVLAARRHRHKLRKGHLAGNRFRCVLRGVEAHAEAEERARQILARLAGDGVPNAFGPQRFGDPPLNAVAGRALVRGDSAGVLHILLGPLPAELAGQQEAGQQEARAHFANGAYEQALSAWPRAANQERRLLKALAEGARPEVAVKMLPKKLKELFVHAYQSALFNRLLAQRLALGLLATLECGDVAYKHANGACFLVEDPESEAPRLARFEISPAGPMLGTKTLAATGVPGEREQALFASEEVAPQSFQLRGGLAQRGERRAYRIPLAEPALHWNEPEPGTCTVAFTLPAGAYATNILSELTKTKPASVERS